MKNIVDKNEPMGAVGKTQHISVSRKDTLINDFKNSTAQGLIAFALSLVGFGMLAFAVHRSYSTGGEAGFMIGVFMIAALIVEITALILGIKGLENRKKIRHYMEKRAIAVAIFMILALIALYIRGARMTF